MCKPNRRGLLQGLIISALLMSAGLNAWAQNPPVADDQEIETDLELDFNGTLTGSDPDRDPYTFAVVAGPTQSAITSLDTNSGAFVLAVPANASGTDSFAFVTNDGAQDSPAATVSITYTDYNEQVPVPDHQTLLADTAVGLSITLTATDPQGDSMTFDVVDGPQNGTLTGVVPNVTYTSNVGYVGVDGFTFRVSDGVRISESVWVSIAVGFSYTVVNLGNLTSAWNDGFDLNDAGEGTGRANVNVEVTPGNFEEQTQGYLYSGGTMEVIGTAGGNRSAGIGINLFGQIAGSSRDGTDTAVSILWDPDTGITNIGRGSGAWSTSNDVNDWQEVVGYTSDSGPSEVSFLWSDGSFEYVIIPGSERSRPSAVNNHGVLVGYHREAVPAFRTPYKWSSNGGRIDLDHLDEGDDNYANDINDQGDVVGQVEDFLDRARAAKWKNGQTGVELIPTLGGRTSRADGVNAFGQVVGSSSLEISSGATRGMIIIDDIPFDLFALCSNPANFTSLVPRKINNFCAATGTGRTTGNDNRPFIASPTWGSPGPVDQNLNVDEDSSVAFQITATNGAATLDVLVEPRNGALSGTVPNLVYTPDLNYTGPDHMTFRAQDGVSVGVGLVQFDVAERNDAPVASDANLQTTVETTLVGTLPATDQEGDGLTYSIVANGDAGTATITNTSTGAFEYVPDVAAVGVDEFTFRVWDGAEFSNTASVTVTVVVDPDAPTAQDASVAMRVNATFTGTLSGSDPTDDPLTFFVYQQSAHGVATVLDAAAGTFQFQPTADFAGITSFTFRVSDGALNSNVATVMVRVNPRGSSGSGGCTLIDGGVDERTNAGLLIPFALMILVVLVWRRSY